MKIVFLGGKRNSGTTSNLSAVAGMLSVLCPGLAFVIYTRKGTRKRVRKETPQTERAEAENRICLIDFGSYAAIGKSRLIDEADLVIINMRQNDPMFPDFYFYEKQMGARVFLLMGAYSGQTKSQRSLLENYYRVAPERIGMIPYNSEFAYAATNGSARKFVQNRYRNPGSVDNERFLTELKNFSMLLLKSMEEVNHGILPG